MLFSKAKNVNKDSVKTQSVAGMLFNPNFGSSVRPLRETTTVFINLLAMIFATQGLFPRNHPSLMGVQGAPRLSLMGVLQTAWSNLTFTKEKIPQIILFFGVVSILGFSVLALFFMLFSIFTAKAHAADLWGAAGSNPTYPSGVQCDTTHGFFAPCDAANDIALNWINYLFNGQTMLNYLNNIGQVVPQSTIIQAALMSALGFYSEAIMCVAAVILFYHLASMIVNTAHHGVVMGKNANQIWAPIRLVFAVGLLIPIAGGLNSGQYIIIKVAEWGSNMADQVWYTFLNTIVNDSAGGVAAVSPYAQKAVYDTVMSQACMAAYNASLNGWSGTSTAPNGLNDTLTGTWPAGTCSYGPLNYPLSKTSGTNLYTPMGAQVQTTTAHQPETVFYGLPKTNNLPSTSAAGATAMQTICGRYTFPAALDASENDNVDTFASAVQHDILPSQNVGCPATGGAPGAFCTMVSEAQAYVANMQAFIDPCFGGTSDQPLAINTAPIEQITADYIGNLNNLYQAEVANIGSSLAAAATLSAAQGWVSAGAWFNTVARDQADLMDVSASIPATVGPMMTNSPDLMYNNDVLTPLKYYSDWVGSVYGASVTFPSGIPTAQQQAIIAEAGMHAKASTNVNGGDNNSDTDKNTFDWIFSQIDKLAAFKNVWQGTTDSSSFSLGVQFNSSSNPLAEIAALGHSCIDVAADTFNAMIVAMTFGGGMSAAGGAAASTDNIGGAISGIMSSVGEGSMGIGSLLGIISATFFTLGFMMAYYLPLIPFFHFFFNVLTWVVSLFEGIIAVPLVALAHLTPEGEGLAGGAKTAYYFIFNIFLRPVLMIFGLICGFLLFFIAVSYMNLLYIQAVAGAGEIAYGHAGLARLVYTAIYVLMLYLSANNCFKLIGFLPENALRWMGQQGLNYGSLTGDPGQLEQGLAYATSAADSKFIQGSGQAAAGLGKLGGGMAGSVGRFGGSLPAGAMGAMGAVGATAIAAHPSSFASGIQGMLNPGSGAAGGAATSGGGASHASGGQLAGGGNLGGGSAQTASADATLAAAEQHMTPQERRDMQAGHALEQKIVGEFASTVIDPLKRLGTPGGGTGSGGGTPMG